MTADELREKVNLAVKTVDLHSPPEAEAIAAIKVCMEAAIDICNQEASDNQTAQKIGDRLSNLIPESAK